MSREHFGIVADGSFAIFERFLVENRVLEEIIVTEKIELHMKYNNSYFTDYGRIFITFVVSIIYVLTLLFSSMIAYINVTKYDIAA